MAVPLVVNGDRIYMQLKDQILRWERKERREQIGVFKSRNTWQTEGQADWRGDGGPDLRCWTFVYLDTGVGWEPLSLSAVGLRLQSV